MIRTRHDSNSRFSLKIWRGTDVRTLSTSYPLIGGTQVISDSRPTLTKTPIRRTLRKKRDPLGSITVNVVKSKPKLGLRPYQMNPVLIQRFSISALDDVLQATNFYGLVSYGPGLSSFDSTFDFLSRPTVETVDRNAESRAIIKCLSKLSSPKHLDLGVGIAELRQTAQFIKSPLKSLVGLFRKFKQSHLTKLGGPRIARKATTREYVDAAADTWLSYRYAFNPLVGDVTGAMCAMSEKLSTDSGILRRVSGRDSWEAVAKQNLASASLSVIQTVYFGGYLERTTKQSVTAVQLYRYKPYFDDAIKLASLGLSPTQLVSTVWELTPFSFIVDWGVNVGSWLRAWEPKPWIELLGSCVSTKTEVSLRNKDFSIHIGGPIVMAKGSVATRTQLSRVVKVLTLPRAPVISQDVLNLSRTFDSLSLAWKPVSSYLTTFIKKR